MKQNRAFTLMELLVVISIIAVLSTMALVALNSVRDDARSARTRSVMSKVRDILQDKLESFESRQVPFGFQKDFAIGVPVLPAKPPGPALNNDLVPNWGQQRFVYKRVLCEWIRTELPTYQEYLFSYPSIESQQPFMPSSAPPVGLAGWDQVANYWPNLPARNWIGIFVRILGSRPSPSFQQIRTWITGSTDNLLDTDPLDNAYWIKENNNGWLAAPVNGVTNSLNGEQMALSITESSELLYAILYSTYDRDGNRGTHFLRPDDLGDVDNDGYPEILDNRGIPLVFSVTVQNIGQNGIPIDRNGDTFFDFRDAIPDTRYPGEPQDYLIHLGSIGLGELPSHLTHLQNADFSNAASFPKF